MGGAAGGSGRASGGDWTARSSAAVRPPGSGVYEPSPPDVEAGAPARLASGVATGDPPLGALRAPATDGGKQIGEVLVGLGLADPDV